MRPRQSGRSAHRVTAMQPLPVPRSAKLAGPVAAFEGRFDEVLGFRAGNEGGGRDPEVPAVEFALSEKVGGGFAHRPGGGADRPCGKADRW